MTTQGSDLNVEPVDSNDDVPSVVSENNTHNIPPMKFGMIVLFVSGGALILAMVGLEIYKEVAQPADSLFFSRISFIVGYVLFALVPALLLVKLQPWSVRKLIRLQPVRPLVVLLTALSLIALILPSIALFKIQHSILVSAGVPDTWLNILQGYDASSVESIDSIMFSHSIPELILVILVIGVVPGICEELIFRGVIFGSFLRGTTPTKAIVIIGLLFAAAHLSPLMFIAMAIGGALLAWVTFRTGSIIPAIAAHITYNSLLAIGLYSYGDMESDFISETGFPGLPLLLVAGICLLVLVAIIRYIASLTRADVSV